MVCLGVWSRFSAYSNICFILHTDETIPTRNTGTLVSVMRRLFFPHRCTYCTEVASTVLRATYHQSYFTIVHLHLIVAVPSASRFRVCNGWQGPCEYGCRQSDGCNLDLQLATRQSREAIVGGRLFMPLSRPLDTGCVHHHYHHHHK